MHVASQKPQHGHVPKTDQPEKFENANNDLIYTKNYGDSYGPELQQVFS